MVTEIELKAHIRSSEELKRKLSQKAEYLYAFEKKDEYWYNDESTLLPSGLRIRDEKRIFPDGREESLTLATYKNKEVRDNIEINDEREFNVAPIVAFEEFLRRIGLKPGRSKQKRGWAFLKDSITAELVEVKDLGWFIELEIVTQDRNEGAFAQGKKRLLELLSDLGITEEAIESRFYSEMLNKKYGV